MHVYVKLTQDKIFVLKIEYLFCYYEHLSLNILL